MLYVDTDLIVQSWGNLCASEGAANIAAVINRHPVRTYLQWKEAFPLLLFTSGFIDSNASD